MVYFVNAKVDHFSHSGLLFSMVGQRGVVFDFTAENNLVSNINIKGVRDIAARVLSSAEKTIS